MDHEAARARSMFVLVVVIACAAFMLPLDAADGTAQAHMITTDVPAAGVAVTYPSDWSTTELSDGTSIAEIRRWLQLLKPEEAELMGIDTDDSPKKVARYIRGLGLRSQFLAYSEESGHALNVQGWRDQPWWRDLDEFREYARESASSSKGKLLSVSETRVGDREAMVHFEQYRDRIGPVVFGHLEIRGNGREVVTVGVTVAKNDRALAESILANVHLM